MALPNVWSPTSFDDIAGMETPEFQERVRDALVEQTHIFRAAFRADIAIKDHFEMFFPGVVVVDDLTPLARARYELALNTNNEPLLDVLDNHYNANLSNLTSKREEAARPSPGQSFNYAEALRHYASETLSCAPADVLVC
jgi:hypothetical protein